MTPEQEKRAIRVLHEAADGCAFFQSRDFQGGRCKDENGRGFNCTACEARELLVELGEKVQGPMGHDR